MTDPYSILGISHDASEDEIKKAYRTLSKKYHPDANINNPNKDALTIKFKEVQNAYDQIMDMRKHGTSYSQYQQQSYGNPYGYNQQGQYQYREYRDFSSFFRDFANGDFQQYQQQNHYQTKDEMYYSAIRNYIQQGYYREAYNVLSQVSERNGLWFYYSAVCHVGMGNHATALDHAKKAMELEPNNPTYQQLYQQIASGRYRYRTHQRNYTNPMNAYANCCYRFLVLELLLTCCCGGRGVPMICCL